MSRIPAILEALQAGKTVYLTTMLKSIKVDQKVMAKWAKAGYELFKATEKNDFIASGKHWVCIDGCNIHIQ